MNNPDPMKTLLTTLLAPEQLEKITRRLLGAVSDSPVLCGAILGVSIMSIDAQRGRKRKPASKTVVLHRATCISGGAFKSTPWFEDRGLVETQIDVSWDGRVSYESRGGVIVDGQVCLLPDQSCHLRDDDPDDWKPGLPRTWTLPAHVGGPKGWAVIHIHHRLKVSNWTCAGIEDGADPDMDALKNIYRVRKTGRTDVKLSEFIDCILEPGDTLEFWVDSPGSTQVSIMVFASVVDDGNPEESS